MDNSNEQPLIFWDRSRVVLDWKCRRARYWGNEYGGLGLSPLQRPAYFDLGDAYHKGVAALKAGVDVEEAVNDNIPPLRTSLSASGLPEEKVEEESTLAEGLIRAYNRHVLPRFMEEYTPLGIEQEFQHEHDGCVQGVKPDSLAERKADGALIYWEEKTTAWLGERWTAQWAKAVQLHSTALAVERKLGREVQAIIVQGAYKGYEKDTGGGHKQRVSVLCYGYQRPGLTGGPETLYVWKAGTKRVPVWEMPGGSRAWIEGMPEEVLAELFVQAPPVFLQRRLVDAFLKQTALREREIRDCMERVDWSDEEEKEMALNAIFPQSFDQCVPAMGAPCVFTHLCFNPHMAEDPLRSGYYGWRQPHHLQDERGQMRLKELTHGR